MKDKNYKVGLLSKGRLFFYIFSLLVFALAVYYFSEIKQEFRLLKKVKTYWLLLSLFLQLGTYLFNALVYQSLLKAYHVSGLPKLKELYKVSVISLFFNQTLPSAGLSGNAFIFKYFQKRKISSSVIFALILAELLIFYAAMELIIILYLIVFLFKNFPPVFYGVLLAGLFVYLLFGVGIILAGRETSFDFLHKRLGRIKFLTKFVEETENLRVGSVDFFSLFRHQRILAIKTFVFQLTLFVFDVLTIISLFYGLGLHVTIALVGLGLIATKIISILPFSPGALILYESSMTYFFVQLGIPIVLSIIVTLIFRLLSFWLPIPAGLLLYRQWTRDK